MILPGRRPVVRGGKVYHRAGTNGLVPLESAAVNRCSGEWLSL
jgi:hypothetical protein